MHHEPLVFFVPALWPKLIRIRAKNPNAFCQSFDLFTLHTSFFISPLSHPLLTDDMVHPYFRKSLNHFLNILKNATGLAPHSASLAPLQHPKLRVLSHYHYHHRKSTESFRTRSPPFLSCHDVDGLASLFLVQERLTSFAISLQDYSASPLPYATEANSVPASSNHPISAG